MCQIAAVRRLKLAGAARRCKTFTLTLSSANGSLIVFYDVSCLDGCYANTLQWFSVYESGRDEMWPRWLLQARRRTYFLSEMTPEESESCENVTCRTVGIFPAVVWCLRGELALPPVRSPHMCSVEVTRPSGSMFYRLLFGSLSCCRGDKVKTTPGFDGRVKFH